MIEESQELWYRNGGLSLEYLLGYMASGSLASFNLEHLHNLSLSCMTLAFLKEYSPYYHPLLSSHTPLLKIEHSLF